MSTRLHELLAAERTPNSAWEYMLTETMHKFKTPATFFEGHSKSLRMIEESPQNKDIEAQAREEKPVTTTVFDTLEYALEIYRQMEDLQFQKNTTNQRAVGTVLFRGTPLLTELPVDQLLGLEARLKKIRELYMHIPTLDATKHWIPDTAMGAHICVVKHPEETTKTDKQIVPVELAPATDRHPAQVQPMHKDVVVGRFTTLKRTGAATTQQKADAIKLVDELTVEIKKARMRANETEVVTGYIGQTLVDLLLQSFRG